jgi:hypothetical protein
MTVTLLTFEHRRRRVQAIHYTNRASHGPAVMFWLRHHGFACYREGDNVVVRIDSRGREEVVVRPGYVLVFDLSNPRRSCRVQVWRGAEFARAFTLVRESVAA